MTRRETCPQPEQFGDATVPAFGYELIRNQLIPELLGKESASILYWSGRKLARLYPAGSEEKIPLFFEQAGWGTLELVDKSRKKMDFECRSSLIDYQIKEDQDSALFSLEAGFIAEQIQQIYGFIAEAVTEIKTGKNKKVIFHIKWDASDPVPANQSSK
jgi:hypothetical protein